jgi:tRNA (uracil-5-)-methyltransferase TRM9
MSAVFINSCSCSCLEFGSGVLIGDRSTNLVRIANTRQPQAAVVADNLALPHPAHSFDFAISIAVVHHLSTVERRVEAVKAVLNLLRPPSSKGSMDGGKALIYVWALEQKDSRRGWDEGHEQDVMVPWVMKVGEKSKKEKGQKKQKDEGGQVEPEPAEPPQPASKTFLRYYHLYRKGELESDIEQAGGKVVESGYEKDNWWAIATSTDDTDHSPSADPDKR